MTPRLCSVHTHSTLCDGKNTLSSMAAAACAAGVRFFGASGHSHTPAPFDAGCVLPADTSAYRAELSRLRQVYEGRMEVLAGVEWDAVSDAPPPDWAQYWIGSVHELYDAASGEYFCVDASPELLEDCRRILFGGDFSALAARYYEAVAGVAAMGPTILGHIDLITKFNDGGRFFDESGPAYRELALRALHAADPRRTLLEVNTGAVSRGYRKTPYPAPFLLREWRAMGGRVILTADAHDARDIVFGYDDAAKLALSCGFGECVLLSAAGAIPCPLE